MSDLPRNDFEMVFQSENQNNAVMQEINAVFRELALYKDIIVKYTTWRKIHHRPFLNKQRSISYFVVPKKTMKRINSVKHTDSSGEKKETQQERGQVRKRHLQHPLLFSVECCSSQSRHSHNQLTCRSWNQKGLVKESSIKSGQFIYQMTLR